MGFFSWWRASRDKARAANEAYKLSRDPDVIRSQVPELDGMNDVDGMAYVMQQIEAWNRTCTPDEAAELAGRVLASNASFEEQGLVMPYWGNLWVLRTLQHELGQDVPWVAPKADE